MTRAEYIKELKTKLLNAAGKYSDYCRYWSVLINLEEKYDQTLEKYNFNAWIENSNGILCQKAANLLGVTEQVFSDMRENAEIELMSVVEEIMECDEEEQHEIWGRDIFLDKKMFKEELLKDELCDWDSSIYTQQEALDYFLGIIEEICKDLLSVNQIDKAIFEAEREITEGVELLDVDEVLGELRGKYFG